MARMTRTKTKKRTTVNRTVPTVVAYDEEGSSPPPSASVVDSIETHELVKPREVVNEIGPILSKCFYFSWSFLLVANNCIK